MQASIEQILSSYNDRAALSQASTIPAPWYVDPRIAESAPPTLRQRFVATRNAIGRNGPVR